MIRVSPWDEPYSCTRSNRSSPSTRRPRRARWNSVALPIPPRPSTIASNAGRGSPRGRGPDACFARWNMPRPVLGGIGSPTERRDDLPALAEGEQALDTRSVGYIWKRGWRGGGSGHGHSFPESTTRYPAREPEGPDHPVRPP